MPIRFKKNLNFLQDLIFYNISNNKNAYEKEFVLQITLQSNASLQCTPCSGDTPFHPSFSSCKSNAGSFLM